jgi:threonine dehydratase
LVSGISAFFANSKSKVQIYGFDPAGAAKTIAALKNKSPIALEKIDAFIDGAAVKRLGEKTFDIIKKNLVKVFAIPEGKVCTNMIELYQNEGVIVEPAGALSIAGLDSVKDEIQGKKVVCIISGGNNDISRYPEIMERSLIYEGLKHYFVIEFAQKPGQLQSFLHLLGPNDDIVRFEYLKKTNKEFGPALVGIELQILK